MLQFELRAFPNEAMGPEDRTFVQAPSDQAIRARAGRLAVRINGPVDIARAGGTDWNDRYLTTASPSEYHAAGYRFEQLT